MGTTMENFMRSETITLEHASSGPFFQIPPKTPNRNSGDVDFNDVFGGPPKRYSTQESRVRYSFGEIVDPEDDGSSSPWNGRKEKPVFRTDNGGRSRYPSDDFFHDIFKGDECYVSPRSFDRDSLVPSSPSLRIMSPVSKAEFFGTSLPPQLSLASKSTTARFSPLAPQNHGQFKMDGTANQLNSSRSSSSSSRFYHRSPLASFSSEDSSSTVTSDMKENGENFKKDNKSAESLTADSQFHFSIYKWAGKGVPMLTPLVDRKNFKNTSKNDRFVSSNGKNKGDFTRSKSSTVMTQDISANIEAESLKTKCGSEDNRSKEETRELRYSFEAPHDILESKTKGIAKNCVVTSESAQDVKTEAVKSRDYININKVKKVENKAPVKPEVKPLRAFLVDEVVQQEIKENETGAPKVEILNVHIDSKSVKKTEEVQSDSNREDIAKSNLKRAAENSSANLGRSGAKGKVKEFVQIFNHEADSRPKPDIPTRSYSNRWKGAGNDQKENEVNVNEPKVKEKVESNDVEKKPDISLKVEKNPNKDEALLKPQTKNPSFRKSFRRDSKVSVENSDDPFEDYFSVQELSPDHETVAQSDEVSEEMKAIDAKIRQWAVGKKGNIRSLLSTLQFVLWPGNGWKPVALVDLIEASAVKRAYQKALLRLHPDKLQQNSAASNQKYIAEKVFDLLQEAWDHFNTLATL
ncbi:J domain-containing protein required for chloroplast accumulation response 1-like isoform X2 [Henckelia pumila]|uniref:J domain-containing protein required for chloroplast accumulation response 1-like isoform X2 n=1 Tax=Henckelia pumila TaxID=405737 RepID=UPI003C6E6AB3